MTSSAFASTAHAPYRVTYVYAANISYIFEIPDPDLSIHFTTYVAVRSLKRVICQSIAPLYTATVQHSVHVRSHVTCEFGKNNYVFRIQDPNLPIHYATFVGVI